MTNIAARDGIDLTVRGYNARIGDAADPIELASGLAPVTSAVLTHVTRTPDVYLGGAIAGWGTVSVYSPGHILDARVFTPTVAAPSTALVATGDVGTPGDPLDTAVNALWASAATGRVMVDQIGALTIEHVAAAGDVRIRAGSMTLGDLTSGTSIQLVSTGEILDGNGGAINLSAPSATLDAVTRVGLPWERIETSLDHLTAHVTGAPGDLHIVEENGLHLPEVFARANLDVTALAGDLELGGLTSSVGIISLFAAGGAILDANGDAVNLTGPTAILMAALGIGTAADPLEVNLGSDSLVAVGDNIYVDSVGPLLHLLGLYAEHDVVVRALQGSLTVGTITAGDLVHLEALAPGGTIVGPTGSLVTARAGEFHADAFVQLYTDVDRIDATAGGAFGPIVTLDGPPGYGTVNLVNSGSVTLGTVTAGNLVVVTAYAPDAEDVTLTLGDAAGGIVSGRTVLLGAMGGTARIVDGQGDDALVPRTNVAAHQVLMAAFSEAPGQDLIGTAANPIEVASLGTPLLLGGETHVTVLPDVHLALASVTAGNITVHSPTGSILDANGAELNLVAPSATLLSAGTIGTAADPIDTNLGFESLYAMSPGSMWIVELDGLTLGQVISGEDVSVKTLTGDILVKSVTAAGTVFLDAERDIRSAWDMTPQSYGMGWQITAEHGDLHAGRDIALATHVLRLDATAGSAETRTGDLDITNYGWLHLLGTITAGDDLRLSLEREMADSCTALLVVLGGPDGGLISGRTVRLDVGGGGHPGYTPGGAGVLGALSALDGLDGLEALRNLPFTAVIDGQLLDNWLPGEPTTNIAAHETIEVNLEGPWWMPKLFGIPYLAPIEVTARRESNVDVNTGFLGLEGVEFTDDVWLRTATSTAGTLSVWAPRGDVRDANGALVNLDAPTVAMRVFGDIGKPDDPLETRIGNESLYATARHGGVWLVEEDGLHIARVRAEGDVDIRSTTGDILLGRVTSGGSIRLEAVEGNIFDANGDLVNLVRRAGGFEDEELSALALTPTDGGAIASYLIAGGVIGTLADAIEVRIEGGTLWAGARGKINCVSVNLAGEVEPVNGLDLMWKPPGNVYWNGTMIYQGCRPIGPSGEEEEPFTPPTPPTPPPGPAEPEGLIFELPGAADPSRQFYNPTANVTPARPIPPDEVEQRREQLIDVSQMMLP